jgi:hypothetical protein
MISPGVARIMAPSPLNSETDDTHRQKALLSFFSRFNSIASQPLDLT